jgi:mono/diheme cytochrome c family protein
VADWMRARCRTAVFALASSGWIALVLSGVQTSAQQTSVEPARAESATTQRILDQYCLTCHNTRLRTAGLALDTLEVAKPAANAEVWERVIGRLRARSMPPAGLPRPDAAAYDRVARALEADIDRAWAAHPQPGRIGAVHRLNRVEYTNAIRDLFALEIDVASQLPGDETADGSFDNFADVLTISTAHLERYLSVARQVTRLAVGLAPAVPAAERFEIPLHVVQEDRQSEDLPLGSRGGMSIHYEFPVDGEYAIRVRLRRQYQDYVMGMGWPQQLDVRLDGALVKRFSVGGEAKGRPAGASYAGDGEPGFGGDPQWERYMQIDADAGLEVRLPVKAGSHQVGVSFVRALWEPEGLPQPLQRGRVLTNDEIYMGYASVGSVHIGGPYRVDRTAKDTASRRAIFTCHPGPASDERDCAGKILARIARLAYRRPTTSADVQTLLDFFEQGRRGGGDFDAGIQFALERLLVDPDFLLRVYRDPPAARGPVSDQRTYRLSDLEVASRMSFFLWNSIPDQRLLTLAEHGVLSRPEILEQQVRRMLNDPRATAAFVDNFAAQWLNLRRVREVVVHPEVYPDFDDSLLEAFEQETKLFLASTLRDDRSVLDLLRANYTFVNERLARHYGIPGVYGSRYRRVTLPSLEQRGGLLGHGSMLATTSYPERTSPVLRGKWLLDNILGTPPPPPPPGVTTTLPEPKAGAVAPTIRERLAQHRQNPTCASCHSTIDPLGFALENFDAIGGWRTIDESGKRVDARGTMAGGRPLEGLSGLRAALLERPEQFPAAVTEKMFAYALGRRLEYYDQPAVRQILRSAAPHDYRWSSLIVGIVKSPTFLMRATEAVAE